MSTENVAGRATLPLGEVWSPAGTRALAEVSLAAVGALPSLGRTGRRTEVCAR